MHGAWDGLLGYIDPAPIEGDVFYFIRAGHGAEYNLSKAAFALVLAMAALCCAGLFISVPLVMLCVDILRRKTCMERAEVFFTPLIPMAVILIAAQILPQSPFSYGLYTFSMNGGMLVWFIYLLKKS